MFFIVKNNKNYFEKYDCKANKINDFQNFIKLLT